MIRDQKSKQFVDQTQVFFLADLGGRVASLSTPAYLSLKDFLGYGTTLSTERISLLNTISEFDERILSTLNVPFRRLYIKPSAKYQNTSTEDGSFKDEWGVEYKKVGHYHERVGHPLSIAKVEDLADFPWPNPSDTSRTSGLSERLEKLSKNEDLILIGGHISAGIFQDCWNLRGMERFLIDLIEDREFAEALLDKVTEIHIGMWENFLSVIGTSVEIVETADDLGGQHGLLISPKMYKEIIKPRHIELNNAIRKITNAKILFHSCGAIQSLIPDLIDSGIDILNPIQPLPNLMDPITLNAKYGDQIIFHGGLDVQLLLINGTPEDVRKHVRHYAFTFGPERYIMAPANTIQPGTPPENIVAAYEEISAINKAILRNNIAK